MMNKEAVIKALKEMGRVVVLALIAWLLTGGVEWLVGSFEINMDLKIQIIAIITLLLRGIDKWLHELGVENKNDKLVTGITRF